MTILKKGCRYLAACLMLFSILSESAIFAVAASAESDSTYITASEAPVAQATHLSGEEILTQIEETYSAAKSRSGRRSFYNRCSTLVNWSTVVLGIQTELYSCHGKNEYDQYVDATRTDCGYDVVRYPASEYSLESALNAISENGTWDVYNIIIGWQGGSSYSSRAYGHTCFIHAIIDGYVYFYESYGLEIGGTYYREGSPIVCTIAEFANYYNRWAKFEGAVHFDFPDTGAPVLSEMEVSNISDDGFTLTFDAEDDIEITDIYAKVWTYGNSQEEGCRILPVTLEDGVATVQVDIEDFDGFVGRYYAAGYARDHKGNEASTALEGCVNLYTAESAEGTYRVLEDETGVHNAPYASVNGASTLEYTMDADTRFDIVGTWVNDNGETWYQLEDGSWVGAANVERLIQWSEVVAYLTAFLTGRMQNAD